LLDGFFLPLRRLVVCLPAVFGFGWGFYCLLGGFLSGCLWRWVFLDLDFFGFP